MSFFKAARLCALSAVMFYASPVHAAEPATDVIKKFDAALLSVMKNASQLGVEGRFKKLDPVIRHVFNIPLMTKIVVGPQWAQWSTQQQQQVTAAFGKFITSTYAIRFDGYGGESFVEQGQKPVSNGVVVMTQLVRQHDDPIALNYVMRQNPDGAWQIVDVFLTGSISELATRRSEFSAVLEHQGFSGLLKELADKSKAAAP